MAEELRLHRVFTQLVRNNQFSALGLALVAELAKVRKTISSYADIEGESENDAANTRAAETLFAAEPTEDFGEAVVRSMIEDSTIHDPTIPATVKLSSRSTQAGILHRSCIGDVDSTELLDGTRGTPPPRVRSVKALLTNEAEPILLEASRKEKIHMKKQADPIDYLFDGLG